MKVPPMLRAALVCAAASLALALQASCATGEIDEPSDAVFIAPNAPMLVKSACVETRCPPPLATCPGDRAPCATDLSSDVDHCGACETPCPKATITTHGEYLCSESQCRLACSPLYADCNGTTADGCETKTGSDPKNCGGCGVTCAEGEICWRGACGCPSGFTQCGNDCKNLQSDDENCSACGSLCRAPESDADPRWICGPKVTPANTKWTCAAASCQLLCKPGYGDCNDQFCGDGCEVDLRSDPNNCGACGNVCNSGQACVAGTCMCPDGLASCDGECVDLSVDPNNCGYCGNECPGPASTRPGRPVGGGPSCEGGECKYVCFPGWADCDGRVWNGCEAHLDRDQNNCGACGNACEIAAGQPCVSGACLTKPCEEGPLR